MAWEFALCLVMSLSVSPPWPDLSVFSGAALLAKHWHQGDKEAILLALQMRELVIDMVCCIAECRRTLHLSFHPVAFHFSQRGLHRCKACISLELSHSRHTVTQYDFRYFMK